MNIKNKLFVSVSAIAICSFGGIALAATSNSAYQYNVVEASNVTSNSSTSLNQCESFDDFNFGLVPYESHETYSSNPQQLVLRGYCNWSGALPIVVSFSSAGTGSQQECLQIQAGTIPTKEPMSYCDNSKNTYALVSTTMSIIPGGLPNQPDVRGSLEAQVNNPGVKLLATCQQSHVRLSYLQ